jgi:3D (Asp-Asp-Asp) domain-containing protein
MIHLILVGLQLDLESGGGYKSGTNTVAGGGSGWYGGGSGNSAGGGSGYVYTESTAPNYPSGCLLTSDYYLKDAATVAGNTSFESPSGGTETGHSGNGYVKITYDIATTVNDKMTLAVNSVTTNSASVTVTPKSGLNVTKYEFSSDNGSTWTSNGNNGTYLGQFLLTGYCPCVICCGKTNGITACGTLATANHTIATDGRYAFGTKMLINGVIYTVEDRGGAIQGNRIDVFFPTHQEALNFGRQTADVYIID